MQVSDSNISWLKYVSDYIHFPILRMILPVANEAALRIPSSVELNRSIAEWKISFWFAKSLETQLLNYDIDIDH